jgi:hypothetical protein
LESPYLPFKSTLPRRPDPRRIATNADRRNGRQASGIAPPLWTAANGASRVLDERSSSHAGHMWARKHPSMRTVTQNGFGRHQKLVTGYSGFCAACAAHTSQPGYEQKQSIRVTAMSIVCRCQPAAGHGPRAVRGYGTQLISTLKAPVVMGVFHRWPRADGCISETNLTSLESGCSSARRGGSAFILAKGGSRLR